MGRQILLAALLLATLAATTTADHKVYINWLAGGNYTGWGDNHGPFTQADWLVFYSPDQLLVAQVSESDYHRCDSSHAIYKYQGPEVAIQLFEPQTYYFISSFDLCRGGMHLVIEAKQLPPPTPSARHDMPAAITVDKAAGTTSGLAGGEPRHRRLGHERGWRERRRGRDEERMIDSVGFTGEVC